MSQRALSSGQFAARVGAGVAGAALLAGGVAGGAAGVDAAQRAVDEVRWNAHAYNPYHGGVEGRIQLSKDDWIAAGRPGTAAFSGPGQADNPAEGQATRTPGYETGEESGIWRRNEFGGRQLEPLKDIQPGAITAANGETWKY